MYLGTGRHSSVVTMMDIYDESAEPTPPIKARKFIAPIDDAHPFDLDAYIANYSGRPAVVRLIHIMETCPAIAQDAFRLAVHHIHQSRDPMLYQQVLSAYEQVASLPDLPTPLPNPMEIAPLDTEWADEVTTKNTAEKTKLEVELKTYTNNMIKESIRMAHRDLGEFYRSIGDYINGLKHLTKSREFCATSQHVLDMCLSVLALLLEQRNYAHLPTYIFKAESALGSQIGNIKNSGAAVGTGKSKDGILNDRNAVQSKLDLATALSHLAASNYARAAQFFLKIGPVKDLGDWVGKFVTASDIAIYATLCALSSLPRQALKSQLLEIETFATYLEQEPYIRELIEAYMSCDFKTVLATLSKYSTRHLIDIHLSPHIAQLTAEIKNWAIVLYFQPFVTIRLDRMSSAFGWTLEEVETNILPLIQSGKVQGRIDSQNKILHAKQTDYRAELFARAIRAGADIQAANRKLLLRMKLQQAELVIKPPKSASHYNAGGLGGIPYD